MKKNGRKLVINPSKSKPAPSKRSKAPLPGLPPKGFTHKEWAFIAHFMVSYNKKQAAIAAGYSVRSAAELGYETFSRPHVRGEISRRRHAMAENMEAITKERIEYELASCGLSNMADYAPLLAGEGSTAEHFDLLTRTQAAAVKQITVEEFRDGRSDWRTVRRTKFVLHDKPRSLELLARIKGLVVDKIDHTHKHQGMILHALLKDIAEADAGRPIVDVTPELPGEGSAA